MTRRYALLLGLVLLLALCVGAWIGAPKVLRRVAFFRIHQVDVVGNHYLTAEEVVRHLGLPADASIFDPLGRVRAAAAAIPGTIAAASSVERLFPGTLRVTIVETLPVALVPVNDQLVLLDARGHLLPFDPARVPVSLPVTSEDSLTAALLARLRLAEPQEYNRVITARRVGGDIVLEEGAQLIRVRPNADLETLRSIGVVRRYLEENQRPWSEIDARYDGRLFARKAKA